MQPPFYLYHTNCIFPCSKRVPYSIEEYIRRQVFFLFLLHKILRLIYVGECLYTTGPPRKVWTMYVTRWNRLGLFAAEMTSEIMFPYNEVSVYVVGE